MASDPVEAQADTGDDEPTFVPRKMPLEGEIDFTPMIDCTFLLLIFFIVCGNNTAKSQVKLPIARYGGQVGTEKAIMLTLAKRDEEGNCLVYLAGDKTVEPLPTDPLQEEELVRQHSEQGIAKGFNDVVIKAERGLMNKEVQRIARAATAIEGSSLNLFFAVKDKE